MSISKNPSASLKPSFPKDWVAQQCVAPINQVAEKFGVTPDVIKAAQGYQTYPSVPQQAAYMNSPQQTYDINPFLSGLSKLDPASELSKEQSRLADLWDEHVASKLNQSNTPWPISPLAQSVPTPMPKSPSTIFGPLNPVSQPYSEDGIYYEPVRLFVSQSELVNSSSMAATDKTLCLLATRQLRNQLGPSAVKLAKWRGADFEMETRAWRCMFLVPEDIVAKARAAAKKAEPQPLAEIPETLTIEIHESELSRDPSGVTRKMQERLIAYVGTELANKATIKAESYDGTRRKYVNVYSIPGGSVSATVAKARTKAFDRPGAGNRLIRIRKTDD